MKPAKDSIICVIDHGLFLPIAQKLAEQCKHAYYWTPWDKAYPNVKDWVIGEGFKNMTRVESIWDVKKDCDAFVFFDIGFSGLQLELESQGLPVWGSRKADTLETNRGKFLKTLTEIGLPVPKYKTITGLTKLREHLRSKTDKFIKVSRWRGNCETFHWRDWDQDEGKMDLLAVKLGPVKEMIAFYVCDPIETDIEDGMDTFCINGVMPKTALHGVERKDQGYLSTVTQMDDMPEIVSNVSEKFAPVLAQYNYRNFFSTEIRIKDDEGYFLDPTCRAGVPPSQVMIELYGNLADIILSGANGECIEPEPVAEFGAQVLIKSKGDVTAWTTANIPKEIRQWVKTGNACQIEDMICSPPDEHGNNDFGWLCAIGDTIQETLDNLNKYADQLPDNLECDPSCLAHLLTEIKTMEDEGLPFTDQEVPEPEAVLANGD